MINAYCLGELDILPGWDLFCKYGVNEWVLNRSSKIKKVRIHTTIHFHFSNSKVMD